MISNISGEDKSVSLGLGDSFKVYLVDEEYFLTEAQLSAAEFEIRNNQVVFITNK